MYWLFRNLRFLFLASTMEFVAANNQCRTEVNIQEMALKRSVLKRWSVAAPHLCDVKCGQEIMCQSYNYNRKYQICELNYRTKEARPENFLSAPSWFYIRRLNGRAPLGSIPELPAISCLEIKASEGKNTISGKYWLDPTGTGKAILINCDMASGDMDECKYNISDCDVNANCTNTYVSYKCTCKAGYTGDGHSCSDVDECSSGDHTCDENANCTNTKGSHFCTCMEGYTGDGKSCQYIDECKGKHSCHVNATCTNTKGSYVCTCDPGYIGNGSDCTDIDECKGNHSCHVNATCTNTKGSYVCTCDPGYTGNGSDCTDIDECKGKNSCHVDASCMNTKGSYVCACHPGHIGNGSDCTDIDECKGNHSCHANATCTNTKGSYVCTCHPGYTGNGSDCTDIDECKGNHSCGVNATCANTFGSYSCQCYVGYTGNGRKCTADPCYHYKNLSDSNRKISYVAPYGYELCDRQLSEGWYRFVGASGTKMPTTRVPAYRCGTDWPGWLNAAHPTVEDGEVLRSVCFSDRYTGCKYSKDISVKTCGTYFIYKLQKTPFCSLRYSGTD